MKQIHRDVTTAILVIFAVALPGLAQGQGRWGAALRTGTHVGLSAGLAALGGQSDNSDLFDATAVLGLIFTRSLSDNGAVGLRFDGSWARLSGAPLPGTGLDARTRLLTVVVGPNFTLGAGQFSLWFTPSVGAAGTILRGTTNNSLDPADKRDINETSWSFAYGFAAGPRLFVSAGDHALALEASAWFAEFGSLKFVRPTTGVFEHDTNELGLRLGITVRL